MTDENTPENTPQGTQGEQEGNPSPEASNTEQAAPDVSQEQEAPAAPGPQKEAEAPATQEAPETSEAPKDTEPPKETKEPETPEKKGGEQKVLKPEDYKIPEGLPKELGSFASEAGLTQEQLDKTIRTFGAFTQAQEQASAIALRKMGEAHVKNWGDDAKYKLALAKRALQQNDPDGKMAEALKQTGYGNHPAVLDFLYNIGKSMKEGGFLKSAVNAKPGKKSLAERLFPNHK